jgi:hypothetical protein
LPRICWKQIPTSASFITRQSLLAAMGGQVLLGHAKLTTTAQYTHAATKTIKDTVSPYEMLAGLQDHTIRQGLE